MSVGVIMMVHEAFDRAEQVARHWANGGCPVVIHVDKKISSEEFDGFVENLRDLKNIEFCKRFRCDWGTWGLVAAVLAASEQILDRFPDIHHVYLASGACLPLRPIAELIKYLDERPNVNFIESVTTEDVHWTTGGLDIERFTLRFPFSWKKNRKLFDKYVRIQRRIGHKRRIPDGISPHLGSQWWCLSRDTLSAILTDTNRRRYDRYFSKVWIPDESYFQTLVRRHSDDIESRSLTLSKFDFQGKPHVFYDDHLQLLRQSNCFVARKIWPYAEQLYEEFLTVGGVAKSAADPNSAKIDRIFSGAVERRTNGRSGLIMQSRYPLPGYEKGMTSAPYSVFCGFGDLFEGFEKWLGKTANVRAHGHLYDPDYVGFSGGQKVFVGSLSDSTKIRDYNPKGFLTSLIWNTRGERQCFQFGPRDNQDIVWQMATDPDVQISVISGAWAVPLFYSKMEFSEVRKEAAKLQKAEAEFLSVLRSIYAKARIRIWTLAEFVESPIEQLQNVLDEMDPRQSQPLTEVPKMLGLNGFGQFLQDLKNGGMQPYLMGEFPNDFPKVDTGQNHARPYLVK